MDIKTSAPREQSLRLAAVSLGAVAILSFAILVVLTLLTRKAAHDLPSYILVSSRDYAEDATLNEIVARSPSLTYVRAESKFAQELLKLARCASPPPLLLVDAIHPTQVVRDPRQIERTLDDTTRLQVASSHVLFCWMGAMGLLLGTFRPRLVARSLPLLLATAAGAALYKAVHACVVCAPVTVFGLDAAKVGFTVYAAAAVAALLPSAPIVWLARTIPAAVVPWQVVQFAQGNGVCVPCTIVLAANLACVGSLVALPEGLPKTGDPSLRRRAWSVAAGLVAFVVIALGGRLSKSDSLETKKADPAMWKRASFVGTPIASLVASGLDIPQKGCIVELGVATCHACQSARRYLSGVVDPPIRFVEVLRPDERRTWGGTVVEYDHRLRGVPILLTVSGDGLVIGQIDGWADDRRWIDTALNQAREDLSRAASRKKHENIR